MNSKTTFKTINDFLFQEKMFKIPNYQRGFKWAVKLKDKDGTELPSAVERLLDDILSANKETVYFLQGVTVTEENNEIVLIDGQQRTTTLYLLLWCLGIENIEKINLVYDIRKQSKEFIHKLKEIDFDYSNFDIENKHQDVFYFKKAIKQIKTKIDKLKEDEKKEFINFLLNKVTILYIVIDKDKATKTFTMMNGAKATMLQEELVKAEMLRKVSLPDVEEKQVSTSIEDNLNELKEIITKDWETNALRSRYAREWDKWLYWWNRDDVKEFFNVQNPMGLLLSYYFKRLKNDDNKNFNFENFRLLITDCKQEKQKTKLIFKEIRDLQKSFEDIFNTPIVFNYLGMALIASEDKFEAINYFIINFGDKNKLRNYSNLKLVGATHKQIVSDNKNEEEILNKLLSVRSALNDDYAFFNQYDICCKELLRLNIKEDNHFNRKFDFSIWRDKSLEHIFPKSKVYHKNEQGVIVDGKNDILSFEKTSTINDGTWLNRESFEKFGSEHCIGNLVLLYGKNNSEFGAKTVNDKKKTYFDLSQKFSSRHLMHTISVFSHDTWGIAEIQNNKREVINQFESDYNLTIKAEDQYGY